jgi:hypothetical protein
MDPIEKQIVDTLTARYGLLVNSAGLRTALGFASQGALRAAINSGRIAFRVFTVPGRRGRYALTHEVAAWLAKQARDAEKPVDDVNAKAYGNDGLNPKRRKQRLT